MFIGTQEHEEIGTGLTLPSLPRLQYDQGYLCWSKSSYVQDIQASAWFAWIVYHNGQL